MPGKADDRLKATLDELDKRWAHMKMFSETDSALTIRITPEIVTQGFMDETMKVHVSINASHIDSFGHIIKGKRPHIVSAYFDTEKAAVKAVADLLLKAFE